MLNLDDPRLRLNNLLTRFEALSSQPTAPHTQSPPEEAVEAFDHLVRDVIRPAMEQIGAELERRDHQYEIVITPGQQIMMNFYPRFVRRSAYCTPCCPYVSFSGDPSTGKVHVVQSTLMPDGRGRAETTDTRSTAELTRHYVETQILNTLEKVLDEAEG